MKRFIIKTFSFLLFLSSALPSFAQDSTSLHQHITNLSSRTYFGRGYVGKGMQKAANYIKEQFIIDSVKPLGEDYFQNFSYSVNTFPGVVDVKINGRTLAVAEHYLVNPASNSVSVENEKVKIVDGFDVIKKINAKKGVTAQMAWDKWVKSLPKKNRAVFLNNMDTVRKIMNWRSNKDLTLNLPRGLYFIKKSGKPIWPVSQLVGDATLIELYDSTVSFDKKTKVDVTVINKFEPKFKPANVTGIVSGTEQPDSYIVITAHYDHIGKMGSKALFPGASDNASGTAMLLELAKYYAANPARYSMVFLAFGGEEAGLIGSKFFVDNPKISLKQIRFLINLDILGDATNGISVVNGEKQPEAHALLARLNAQIDNPLPEVRKGGPAANSDHHHFSESGVPAIFIFSMGGKGWYHDIWDKADQITLKNIPTVAVLIKNFIAAMQEKPSAEE